MYTIEKIALFLILFDELIFKIQLCVCVSKIRIHNVELHLKKTIFAIFGRYVNKLISYVYRLQYNAVIRFKLLKFSLYKVICLHNY